MYALPSMMNSTGKTTRLSNEQTGDYLIKCRMNFSVTGIGSKFSVLSKTSIVLFEFPPFAISPCLFKLKSAHLYRNTRRETSLSCLYNLNNFFLITLSLSVTLRKHT